MVRVNRDRERDRDRETETETDRQTDRQTDRNRDTQRDSKGKPMQSHIIIQYAHGTARRDGQSDSSRGSTDYNVDRDKR